MSRPRTVPLLTVSAAEMTYLDRLARSRTASVRTVTRARILAAYVAGTSGPVIARDLGVPLPTVMRCVKKAWALGAPPGARRLAPGGTPAAHYHRGPGVDREPRVSTAQGSEPGPRVLDRVPPRPLRARTRRSGRPSQAGQIQQGTISKLLPAQDRHPHRVQYSLQRKDPHFDAQRVPVLHVCQQVTFAKLAKQCLRGSASSLRRNSKPASSNTWTG